MAGSAPEYFSHSTTVTWPQQPCASREVPMSRVSTFGLPWTQSGCSAAPGLRIVPGAGGQLQHAGHDVVCDRGGGQARAAIVEQADDVAIGDAAARGIGGVETDGFAAGDLFGLAVGTEVELAVQPGRRLVGDQRQRVARIGGSVEGSHAGCDGQSS